MKNKMFSNWSPLKKIFSPLGVVIGLGVSIVSVIPIIQSWLDKDLELSIGKGNAISEDYEDIELDYVIKKFDGINKATLPLPLIISNPHEKTIIENVNFNFVVNMMKFHISRSADGYMSRLLRYEEVFTDPHFEAPFNVQSKIDQITHIQRFGTATDFISVPPLSKIESFAFINVAESLDYHEDEPFDSLSMQMTISSSQGKTIRKNFHISCYYSEDQMSTALKLSDIKLPDRKKFIIIPSLASITINQDSLKTVHYICEDDNYIISSIE